MAGESPKSFPRRLHLLSVTASPSDEPTSGSGVQPAQFIRAVENLARGGVRGTVIKRLQRSKSKDAK